eukprot:scaffold395_cov243-Pinguiococcus_pyrenoidosus.AAC.9
MWALLGRGMCRRRGELVRPEDALIQSRPHLSWYGRPLAADGAGIFAVVRLSILAGLPTGVHSGGVKSLCPLTGAIVTQGWSTKSGRADVALQVTPSSSRN